MLMVSLRWLQVVEKVGNVEWHLSPSYLHSSFWRWHFWSTVCRLPANKNSAVWHSVFLNSCAYVTLARLHTHHQHRISPLPYLMNGRGWPCADILASNSCLAERRSPAYPGARVGRSSRTKSPPLNRKVTRGRTGGGAKIGSSSSEERPERVYAICAGCNWRRERGGVG
jgi:hypothetical protein